MSREGSLLIQCMGVVALVLGGRAEAQSAQLGNQPPPTATTACSNTCVQDGGACPASGQDRYCCNSSSVCLAAPTGPGATLGGSSKPVCGPQRAIGGTCSANHDCVSNYCDTLANLCEPASCDCSGNPSNTCSSSEVCVQALCVSSQMAMGANDCSGLGGSGFTCGSGGNGGDGGCQGDNPGDCSSCVNGAAESPPFRPRPAPPPSCLSCL
jgi:hypothetical protein